MSYQKLTAFFLIFAGLASFANAQTNLTAETSLPITVPGNTILGLAELAAAADVANIQVATGQTLTNAMQNVAEGNTDIGSAPFILTFLMSKGAGPYAKLGKEEGAELTNNLSILYTYRFGTYVLSAFESKNFGGWDAIEGSTIFNGPPRGAALNRARTITKIVTGLDEGDGYTGLQVNWGQAVKTMTDGSADAHILPTYFPDGRLTQASASGKMVAFSMPKDKFESEAAQKYIRAPGSISVIEPKANLLGPNIRVESEDDLFRSIGDIGGEFVNVSMNEEVAYELTKTFLAGLENIYARTPMMKTVLLGETSLDKTGMCGDIPVKYHPGAVRAWEEAGYSIPECAKP